MVIKVEHNYTFTFKRHKGLYIHKLWMNHAVEKYVNDRMNIEFNGFVKIRLGFLIYDF